MKSFILSLLDRQLVVGLLLLLLAGWGIHVAPFDTPWNPIPRDSIPVDAIPDLGENQQIVFTPWPGRSPQDIEDQVTFPLTSILLNVPGVKTIRSVSMFGFSTVYVLFKESAGFYDSRTRILEKLSSIPRGTLPADASPALGPDATPLGQVYWYTLEGRDEQGNPSGGWDLDELRSIQDFQVRYALMTADGVAEVASIGGFRKEYQVNADPDALRQYGVTLNQLMKAVADSNLDVGARTLEINRVEYFVRGSGWIQSLQDLEETVIHMQDGVPVRIQDVAHVQFGPEPRRGVLDKGGAEAVGGGVVARFGANPLSTIQHLKEKIADISKSLPSKVLEDGRLSKLTLVPFYDRSNLIHETLFTLQESLMLEILITIIVVLVLLRSLWASLMVSSTLPLGILFTFGIMKVAGVDANIVALSGIAIAIGTIVDMGIVLTENIAQRLRERPKEDKKQMIAEATQEVGPAILTAVATTIIGFLPVFAMTGAEGKLFRPLAFTKTFSLIGALLVAFLLIPILAERLRQRPEKKQRSPLFFAVGATLILALWWKPLGESGSILLNFATVFGCTFGLLSGLTIFQNAYEKMLRFFLHWRKAFLAGILLLFSGGLWSWQSMGQEFMPPLDEGSFLYMPTTMPHASIGEATDILAAMDQAIEQIPEIKTAVGKIGRAETALDPAPVSMVETIIQYNPEYSILPDGTRKRNWRDHIRSPDDIWDEIIKVAQFPGATSAPKLQPIAARIVMLQSGMRAAMGVKVQAPDLLALDRAALAIETALKKVPGLVPATVVADRVVGKPYLEFQVDREACARYGISVRDLQGTLAASVGGKTVTTSIEGRERYPVRVRYARELRDSLESLQNIQISAKGNLSIPLEQLGEWEYVRGPQAIRTENTFPTAYVVFDKEKHIAEVDAIEKAQEVLNHAEKNQDLILPEGATWQFVGTWENQVRAKKTLAVLLPTVLLVILLLLHLQFRSLRISAMVFSGVFIAWSGGFLLLSLWPGAQLSVAVWVGFLALFGIATDDGVVMATYLQQTFRRRQPKDRQSILEAIVEAGKRRVRPCLMTTATTLLALLPILTSTGRGSDVMIPMAIPVFGGMLIALLSMFLVPVLWSLQAPRVRS